MQIVLINLSGQEYQFNESKGLRILIELTDSYFNNSKRLNDTASITYYDKTGNKIKTLYKYIPMLYFDSLENKTKCLNEVFGLTNGASKYKYNTKGELLEEVDYGVLFDTFFDTTFINWTIKYSYPKSSTKKVDTYNSDKKLEFTDLYQYDKQERIVKHTYVNYLKDNKVIYYKPNSIDIDWSKMSTSLINGFTTIYSYSKSYRIGQIVDSSGFDRADTTFYNNSLISKVCSKSKTGDILNQQLYKYNDHKQLIEFIQFLGKGADYLVGSANRFTYEYDTEGYLSVKNEYFNDILMQKYHYKRIKK